MKGFLTRSVFSTFFTIITLFVNAGNNNPNDRPFRIGEELNFRIKYGWFNITIGKATVKIPSDTIVDGESFYNVNVTGQTAGCLGFFNNTVDRFEAIISKSNFRPFKASQNFQERRKRDIQTNYFDFESGKVKVEKTNDKKSTPQDPKYYDLEPEAYDMLSSYLYLRSIDYSSLKLQDSIMVKVFFGKKHYDFGIEYGGDQKFCW